MWVQIPISGTKIDFSKEHMHWLYTPIYEGDVENKLVVMMPFYGRFHSPMLLKRQMILCSMTVNILMLVFAKAVYTIVHNCIWQNQVRPVVLISYYNICFTEFKVIN